LVNPKNGIYLNLGASPGGHPLRSLLVGFVQDYQGWNRRLGFFQTIIFGWFLRKSLGATPDEKKAEGNNKKEDFSGRFSRNHHWSST
jgi:hypothetical protein